MCAAINRTDGPLEYYGWFQSAIFLAWKSFRLAFTTSLKFISTHFIFAGSFGNGADPWQQSQPSNMAMIKDIQVQCEKDMMRVRIIFDRPFYGMVFSKGHYSNVNCVHVPSGLGQTQVWLIPMSTQRTFSTIFVSLKNIECLRHGSENW